MQHQRQCWGHREKGQEEQEQGEASTWPPRFTQVEMKLQHQESPLEDAPVCSANSLGAEDFQAPLEEQSLRRVSLRTRVGDMVLCLVVFHEQEIRFACIKTRARCQKQSTVVVFCCFFSFSLSSPIDLDAWMHPGSLGIRGK